VNKEQQDDHLTSKQIEALTALHARFCVVFEPEKWRPAFDLPTGWVWGVVDGITFGCSPEGETAT
jgi:hypothetical protein